MKKLIGLCLVSGLLSCLVPARAIADSAGSDWNSSAGFAGTARHQTNMNQADMIAKSASGYYDNVGKTQVYNISTNTVGTMTTETTTINGSSNTVSSLSSSSGSLDASVQLQSLSSSSLLQNRVYDKAP